MTLSIAYLLSILLVKSSIGTSLSLRLSYLLLILIVNITFSPKVSICYHHKFYYYYFIVIIIIVIIITIIIITIITIMITINIHMITTRALLLGFLCDDNRRGSTVLRTISSYTSKTRMLSMHHGRRSYAIISSYIF